MTQRKGRSTLQDVANVKKAFAHVAGDLQETSAEEFLKSNFLPYSWDQVLNRALTDQSGLKPVQRRILYTMYQDGLKPTASRVKVATLGGRVLAYHPHGDASVTEAIKNMARNHVFRVPLIDVRGDAGAPGKPGAAARYLEVRLSPAGWLCVQDIDDHGIDMIPNYDATRMEPITIPTRFPVALVNGGSGIAVGYATNIPSHNPTEIMTALIELVRSPNMTDAKFERIVTGPDFNLGGTVVDHDGVRDYIRTGSGSFRIRGNYTITNLKRGMHRIDFYEIPFGVSQEQIIQGIGDAIEKKGALQGVSSYKNLSDRQHPVRVVIDTKSGVNPKGVVQELFKSTSLEVSFAPNLTIIHNGQPMQAGIKEQLKWFVEFRRSIVRRMSEYKRQQKLDRQHLVDGLMKVLMDIDKAIRIIRNSDTVDDANRELRKMFKIDEIQAGYVLSLQLRRLTKMDSVALLTEQRQLGKDIDALTALLDDKALMDKHLIQEFQGTRNIIKSERRTIISDMNAEQVNMADKEVTAEAEQNSDGYVYVMADGMMTRRIGKTLDMGRLRKYPHGGIISSVHAKDTDEIMLVHEDGTASRIDGSYVSDTAYVTLKSLGLGTTASGVVGISHTQSNADNDDAGLFVMTSLGKLKIAKPNFAKGKPLAISLASGDSVITAKWMKGKSIPGTSVISVSSDGYVQIADISNVSPSGSNAGGINGMRISADAKLVFATYVAADDMKHADNLYLYTATSNGNAKKVPLSKIPTVKHQGAKGVRIGTLKKGETITTAYIGDESTIVYDTKTGTRLPMPEPSDRTNRGTALDTATIGFLSAGTR